MSLVRLEGGTAQELLLDVLDWVFLVDRDDSGTVIKERVEQVFDLQGFERNFDGLFISLYDLLAIDETSSGLRVLPHFLLEDMKETTADLRLRIGMLDYLRSPIYLREIRGTAADADPPNAFHIDFTRIFPGSFDDMAVIPHMTVLNIGEVEFLYGDVSINISSDPTGMDRDPLTWMGEFSETDYRNILNESVSEDAVTLTLRAKSTGARITDFNAIPIHRVRIPGQTEDPTGQPLSSVIWSGQGPSDFDGALLDAPQASFTRDFEIEFRAQTPEGAASMAEDVLKELCREDRDGRLAAVNADFDAPDNTSQKRGGYYSHVLEVSVVDG